MNFSNKKILVIDDDYEIVELVKAILRTKGHNILVAYDGEEGWEILLRERPDLLITDLRMPKASGLEICRRVRSTPELAQTPILVISSMTTGIDKPDEYWAAGLKSDDFLPKPFDPLSLLGRVEYLLRKNEYVSAAPARVGGEPGSGGAQAAAAQEDPADVVRGFIEAWNKRDFAREYNVLGDEMLGGLSINEYVQRRAQAYADENGAEIIHRVLDMDSKIAHNVATVACLREDDVRGIPRRKDERYTLKKTQSGWRIIGVKSRPITFTIE